MSRAPTDRRTATTCRPGGRRQDDPRAERAGRRGEAAVQVEDADRADDADDAVTDGPDAAGGDTATEDADAEGGDDGPPHHRAGGSRWWPRHPLVVTALLTGVIDWCRPSGSGTTADSGLDPDEAGYVATALRYQRSHRLPAALRGLHLRGGRHGHGTAPPAALLAAADPRPPRPPAAFLAQPILMVVGAIFIAAPSDAFPVPGRPSPPVPPGRCSRPCCSPHPSYWLGLCAATCMAAAMFTLVTSDRCTNRRIWWFGLALGCLLLSRTMTIALAPVSSSPESSWRDGTAGGSCAWRARSAFALLVAGRGGRRVEHHLGLPALVRLRPPLRAVRPGGRARACDAALQAHRGGIGTLALRGGDHRHRSGSDRGAARAVRTRRPPERAVEFGALLVAFLTGLAALASTSNNGVWFELPVIAIGVALAGAAIAALPPRPLAAIPIVPLIVMSVVQLPIAWWWTEADPAASGGCSTARSAAPTTRTASPSTTPRFAKDRREDQPAAAADWWRVNRQVAQELRQLAGDDPEDTTITLSGNMQLLNSNSLQLAAELDGWGARIRIPDTTVDDDERDVTLRPLELDGNGDVVRRCCDGAPAPQLPRAGHPRSHPVHPRPRRARLRPPGRGARLAGRTRRFRCRVVASAGARPPPTTTRVDPGTAPLSCAHASRHAGEHPSAPTPRRGGHRLVGARRHGDRLRLVAAVRPRPRAVRRGAGPTAPPGPADQAECATAIAFRANRRGHAPRGDRRWSAERGPGPPEPERPRRSSRAPWGRSDSGPRPNPVPATMVALLLAVVVARASLQWLQPGGYITFLLPVMVHQLTSGRRGRTGASRWRRCPSPAWLLLLPRVGRLRLPPRSVPTWVVVRTPPPPPCGAGPSWRRWSWCWARRRRRWSCWPPPGPWLRRPCSRRRRSPASCSMPRSRGARRAGSTARRRPGGPGAALVGHHGGGATDPSAGGRDRGPRRDRRTPLVGRPSRCGAVGPDRGGRRGARLCYAPSIRTTLESSPAGSRTRCHGS